jgi:hypothetical protein
MNQLEDRLTQLLHERAAQVRVVEDLGAIRRDASAERRSGSAQPAPGSVVVRPEPTAPQSRSPRTWGLVAASVVAVAGVGLTAVARLTSETEVGEAPADPPATASSSPALIAVVDTLDVGCDGDDTTILTPTVQARPDGVHLRVDNTSGGPLGLVWAGGGENAPRGESAHLLDIPPGPARVRCTDIDASGAGATGWGSFTVLEPPGWISAAELDCPTQSIGIVDYVAGAVGVDDPLADAIRTAEEISTADDVDVMTVGYVTAHERSFVVREDGVPTMILEYVSDGHGGWLRSTTTSCT